MKKVLLDFIELSIAAKIAYYRSVIAKMTENDHFPKPDEPLTEAKSVVDNLEAAQLKAIDGGHSATVAMHNCEVKADAAFRILAAYVTRIANGDEEITLSSGFHTSADRTPLQKPELSVANGNLSGSVTLTAKAVLGAGAYIWYQAEGTLPTDDKAWTIAGYSKQATFSVTRLTPGVKYWFRMQAIVSTGVADFTAAVSIMVV